MAENGKVQNWHDETYGKQESLASFSVKNCYFDDYAYCGLCKNRVMWYPRLVQRLCHWA